ncbi:uncharacterized protein B0I36DRAFT_311657 [Microdochium trichocladiopsis]|uniref:DUF8035 domain-containing protein n=1 Tax=Microdochium trichocladiopsis TaxID=1682393 RepID=A0A9P8YFL9_9PEZI|nr:uncharacterized protein B0I36DRAFT_311657 [Microdochium trichocladiopsis]KAH7040862.1 hypothetical protein B0I36DRAFT_311657 [Microdochium trichocladiopsis]
MAYRSSDNDLAYGERWDRDRFASERDRDRRQQSRGPMPYWDRDRRRQESPDGVRFQSRGPPGPPPPRPWEDDYPVRDRRYYEDDGPPRRRRSPDFERMPEREQRGPSPPRRPTRMIRRQSSLDTYDRKPVPRFFEREREEYGPPARRGDVRPEYRPDPYQPIPLPRSRALPPPRTYAERDYEEIKIQEPDRYGNDEYHPYPERVTEREIVRSTRRRDRSGSRTSRRTARSHKSSARSSSRTSTTSSSSSSSSSTSGGTTVTVKSEYPKKGKTRIPARLVSKRAIIDLGYPYTEEGGTIIVQKALGQQNIDDLLKLSEDYKKSEHEVIAARSVAGHVVEERKEEIFTIPPPPPAAPVVAAPVVAAPVVVPAAPAPASSVSEEVFRETKIVREVSPARTSRSYSTSTTSRTPLIIDGAEPDYGYDYGQVAIVGDRRRTDREIKYEIARLEAERDLMRSDHHHHHHHHGRHRSHSQSYGRDVVRAERLPTGELVLYEEEVVKVEEPRRGVRIEKDKKGPPPGLMRAMLATLT